jgi:hypothetical protein
MHRVRRWAAPERSRVIGVAAARGRSGARPDRRDLLDQGQDAYDRFAAGGKLGKIVLTV